jgi:hypothetical protein
MVKVLDGNVVTPTITISCANIECKATLYAEPVDIIIHYLCCGNILYYINCPRCGTNTEIPNTKIVADTCYDEWTVMGFKP